MAVATKTQSKSGFVKKLLSNNPQGNLKAVNDAWLAAKMKGTVGSTLFYKMKSEMGLTGNLRTKPKARSAKAKSGTKMSKKAGTPGKSMFVKEFLHDNPQGNVRAVNEAWAAAGFKGVISKTIIYKVKSSLGLTGSLRLNTKRIKASAKGKKPGTASKVITASVNVQPRGNNSTRTVVLNELETDIDRLLFKVMGVGALTEIEDTLRRARRLLYGALTRG